MLGRLDGAVELCTAGVQAALRELGFLGAALQTALLFAAFGQFPLSLNHPLIQLGVALLSVGQLHVQLFKAGLRRDAALLQLVQQGLDFGQIVADLCTARLRLRHQLRQAQGLDLQFMRARLAFTGLAPHADQALRRIGISGLGPSQSAAAFFGDQSLGALLFLEVFNVLRTAQQTGLLRVLGVKHHTVQVHRVARWHEQSLARLELAAPEQRVFQAGGRETRLQPVGQQSGQTGVRDAQVIGQGAASARQPAAWQGGCFQGRAEK